MTHIINNACELLPSIARGKIGEVWCGLRPTTPDKAPILGTSKHPQVLIAGGYWRNGVLLAPKTAQIISSLILSTKELSASDQELLDAFNWDRFYDKDKAQGLAADIRYKSQMHSIQYRGKGSATAGEELGFYEGEILITFVANHTFEQLPAFHNVLQVQVLRKMSARLIAHIYGVLVMTTPYLRKLRKKVGKMQLHS